jgi:O-antigen/teichoic acid export membrane protein
MGKKQLMINIISNIISFGASLAISFLLTPYLISTIGKEVYSFVPISNNFVSYFAIITIALNSMASRFITIELVKKNIHKAQEYYSSILIANIIMSSILIVPMIIIIIFLDSFLNIPAGRISEIRILFVFAFASMLITIISSVFGISFFAKNRLDIRSGGELFQGILKIILYLFLFTVFKPSILFIGLVAFVLSIVSLIYQYIFTKILLPDFKVSFHLFKLNAVKELLFSGIWMSINTLGNTLLTGITLIMANIFISTTASGELSIVQTFPQLISSIITTLFAVFLPRITITFAEGKKDDLIKEVTFSQKVIGLFTTTPVLLLIIFGKDFFGLWLPDENSMKLQILSILTIIPLLVHGNMWTIYGLNIASNKVRIPSLILVLIGFLSIITCYITLKHIKLSVYIIPAICTFFSVGYYLFFIPLYACAQLRIEKFTFYKHILKTALFMLIALFIGGVAKQYILANTWLKFFEWASIFGVVGLLLNSLLVINKKDIAGIKYIGSILLGRLTNK